MQRICLIEDSSDLQSLVKHEFRDWFHVSSAGSIKEALALFNSEKFDLVLLDVSLPDGSGFELCAKMKTLQGTKDVPVIFLTGKSDPVAKMMGFAIGAEDYVVKPFEPIELRARIGARLRTKQAVAATLEDQQVGAFKFDLVKRRVSAVEAGGSGSGERDLRLTPFEFKLLHFLATHEGQVFGRAELQKSLNEPGIHVNEKGLYTHISALRKKMSENKDCLECIPRVGYRFCDPSKKALE